MQIAFGNVLAEPVDVVYGRVKDYFPQPIRGRCPAQTLHKEIAAACERSQTLPIPFADGRPILEKIRDRGAPDLLAKIGKRKGPAI